MEICVHYSCFEARRNNFHFAITLCAENETIWRESVAVAVAAREGNMKPWNTLKIQLFLENFKNSITKW